ncbi:MAG: Rhodanese-like domain [Acidobacteriota bacterium]|jgi:3-mercaptopyruvate sulfurtransferase SseA|nr:Rhodanese-like domain [Acidobacteriota bacterium]
MRRITAAAIAALFACIASAQMKPTQTPQAKGTIGTSNSNVQITPASTAEASLESARRITREAAMKLVKAKKAVYVDVRPKDQYDQGHIKGAINIPESEIVMGIRQITPGKLIITYCA